MQRQLNDKLYIGCILLSAIKEGVVNMSLISSNGEGFDSTGAWARGENEFARRFTREEFPRIFFTQYVNVDIGTIGLAFINGKVETLKEGRFPLGNVFLDKNDGASVVLMAKSVPLTFTIDARSGNNVRISVTVDTRVTVPDPRSFYEHVLALSSTDHVYFEEIHALLRNPVAAAVKDVVRCYDISEVSDGDTAGKIRSALSSISYLGLHISMVSMSVHEGAWTAVRDERGNTEADVAAARAYYEREVVIIELKAKADLARINAEGRVEEAKRNNRHNGDIAETIHWIRITELKDGAKDKKLNRLLDTYERWIGIDLRKKQREGEIYDGMSVHAQILTTDDPDKRQMIDDSHRREQNISKSPQQIVAESVTDSRDAANALGSMANADLVQKNADQRISDFQYFIEKQCEQAFEHSKQITDVANTSMYAMASTTTAKNTEPSHTIMAGMGVPLTVTSTPQRENSVSSVVKHRNCPNCQSLLDPETGKCPGCGWRP